MGGNTTTGAACADAQDVLSAAAAAAALGLSIKTLEKWRGEGKGPPFLKMGRKVAYRRGVLVQWLKSQETRGAMDRLPMKKEDNEVTAWPYAKDPTRFQVSMFYLHPITGKEGRARKVAPADKRTLEAAIAWGHSERLRIVTGLCQAPVVDGSGEEEEKKIKKARKLADFWPEFEAGHVAKQKRSTRLGYEQTWRCHLRAILGEMRIDQIDRVSFATFRKKLEDKKLLQTSIRKHLERLRCCLEWAAEQGEILKAPEVKLPKQRQAHVEIFSPEDLERMVSAAETMYERVLLLLLTDGALRIGETAGLAWSCVDFRKGVMTINKNVCKGVLQDSPKGEVGDVPLTPRLAAALRALQADNTGPWVLGRTVGRTEHASDSGLGKMVRRLQMAAGIPVHGPHRVRHSVLTLLAEQGVSPYALQAFARHASMKTTMTYYVHVDKTAQARKAVDVLALLQSGNALAPLGNHPENGLGPMLTH